MKLRLNCYVFLSIIFSSTIYSATADITVVLAGKMLDVDRGRLLENQKIIIKEGKITAYGKDLMIPSNAKVIDLSKMIVLPGLIDCHTHLVGDQHDQDPVTELTKTAAQRAFESIPNARALLLAGFTSVRDLGSYRALVNVALRDAINRGDVIGPRMFVSGGYITMTGGGGAVSGVAPDITLPWDLRFGVANGPEEVRQRVRDFASRDVDVIKIFATGAVMQHHSNPGAEDYSYVEMRSAVEEARKKGLRVAAHAHGATGAKEAIRAGVASIEHGTMLDDEAIQLMKTNGTYLVADIYDDECISAQNNDVPNDFQQNDDKLGEIQRKVFAKAVKAKINIAFGTDSYICPHGTNARQFAYQVKYGQTQMQAIQSATINAATLLGKATELGSIQSGKYADLIAVAENPLQNIRSLEQVAFVMKQGVVYKVPTQKK